MAGGGSRSRSREEALGDRSSGSASARKGVHCEERKEKCYVWCVVVIVRVDVEFVRGRELVLRELKLWA